MDPFDPPYLSGQLVSIGAGGHLTLRLSEAALNSPSNPFGLDFIVFGNSGFIITNGDFSGGGITDGTLFGASSGVTRVSVSADNINYFVLNPGLTPAVDGAFPTDGLGNFQLPVNPALALGDFAGQDLAGIRSLYHGSGGGTGFDLSWARDGEGNPTALDSVRYVRFDVLSDKIEIDGITAVPEPSTWSGLLLAGVLALIRRYARR